MLICTCTAVKAVSSATEEDLQRALGYLNFEIVNGHEYGMSDGRFKLPKPAQGVSSSKVSMIAHIVGS